MPSRDDSILSGAISFAAKFGFVTQEIFFDFLCERSQSRQYAYWRYLRTSGAFVESKRDPRIYYLSTKTLRDLPSDRVNRRYFYHIEHDSIAATLHLLLKREFMCERSWTEMQLRADLSEAAEILGSSDVRKLPDYVVDVPSAKGFLRVAFEIEASAKSRERYRLAAFAYLAMANIDLVVYVCDGLAIERTVDAAFSGELFREREKRPACLQLKDLRNDRLQSRVRFLENELKFADLIETATGLPAVA